MDLSKSNTEDRTNTTVSSCFRVYMIMYLIKIYSELVKERQEQKGFQFIFMHSSKGNTTFSSNISMYNHAFN